MTTFNESHIGRRVKNRFGKEGVIYKLLDLSSPYPVYVAYNDGSARYYSIDGKDFRSDDYASITLIEDELSNNKPVFGVGDIVIREDGKAGKVMSIDGSGTTAILVKYRDGNDYYTKDGKIHEDYEEAAIKLVKRAQNKVNQVWLSDEDKQAYEQRVSDYKLDNFLEGFDDVDLWATFIECWHDEEMLGFAKRGVIMQELKKHSVENLSKWWSGKFDMHPQHLSNIEISEIKKAVDDIFYKGNDKMKDLTKKQLQDQISKLQNELSELRESVSTMPDIEPWQPVGGDYYISIKGEVRFFKTSQDSRLYGFERQTKKQAEKALDAMRVFNRLLAYKDEFAPDFVHDETGDVRSYCVAIENCCQDEDGIDVEYGRWVAVMCNASYKMPTDIYFPADIAESLADKLNSGEVVL